MKNDKGKERKHEIVFVCCMLLIQSNSRAMMLINSHTFLNFFLSKKA